MKVKIGDKFYTAIRGLSFDPEADVTGSEVVINRFEVQIKTDDAINPGDNIYLYDDYGALWAKYWIVDAVRTDEYYVRIDAQSVLLLLDRITCDAIYCDDRTVAAVMIDVFGELTNIYGSSNVYTVDSSFDNEYINGFLPEQTARERLQWVCFVIGAYIKSFFGDKVAILPIPQAAKPIPDDKVFWRPDIKYSDYVTAVVVKAYTYTQASGDPATTDKWVEDDNGDIYIQTEQEFRLTNSAAPVTVPPKEIKVDGLTIINPDNASDILSRLATAYFKRIEMDAKVLDAGEYLPGDKCTIGLPDGKVMTGFIQSADFIFGNATGAKIHIAQSDVAAGVKLIIVYMFDDNEIMRKEYTLPSGYTYSIANIYPDITEGNTRTVYYPVNDDAEGTLGSGETYDYEPCLVALEKKRKRLYIVDVDAADENDGVVSIS